MDHVQVDAFCREVSCDYRGERYVVRDNGAVQRLQRTNTRQRPHDGRWTFGTPCAEKGYMRISKETVHRIVATAFHGAAPSASHVVDHIDTNRRNNRPENLRWVTRLENILLNPITSRRITDAFGSIEAFLADPKRPAHGPLGPNYEWMQTVDPAEAKASLARLLEWARRERGTPTAIAAWVERRGLVQPPVTPIAELPETKPSLMPNALQRKWQTPTEFPACPAEAGAGLKDYDAVLMIGGIFNTNQYGGTVVDAKGWTPDGSGLLVLVQMPEMAVKGWALTLVTLEGGQFVHANLGSFFTHEGATKEFTLEQGKEWSGGDTFDDYC